MSLRRTLLERRPVTGETNASDATRVTLREIRDALKGKGDSLSPAAAIELLAASEYPNKHRDLAALLHEAGAPPRARYLAAMSLPRADHRAAEEILVAAARVRDPLVLTGVMRALGQIGGRDALEAIERALPEIEGTARYQAEFAAVLIAHRLGLDGHEVPDRSESDLFQMPPDAGVRMRIRRALSADVESSLISLGPRPYGVELAESPAYEFRTDGCTGMIMLNREFLHPTALDVLRRRKALFAIGALRRSESEDYSPAALFLTTPTTGADRVRLSVHLTNGTQILAGGATVRGDIATWSLLTVRRVGAFPIHAAGGFTRGQLDIRTAVSSTRVLQKARPRPCVSR